MDTQYIDLDKFTVGRSKKSDLRLKIEGLSRVHFTVERRGEEIYISDNKSANGTRIKGRKIPPGLAIAYKARTEVKIGHAKEVLTIEMIDGSADAKYLESIGKSAPVSAVAKEKVSREFEFDRSQELAAEIEGEKDSPVFEPISNTPTEDTQIPQSSITDSTPEEQSLSENIFGEGEQFGLDVNSDASFPEIDIGRLSSLEEKADSQMPEVDEDHGFNIDPMPEDIVADTGDKAEVIDLSNFSEGFGESESVDESSQQQFKHDKTEEVPVEDFLNAQKEIDSSSDFVGEYTEETESLTEAELPEEVPPSIVSEKVEIKEPAPVVDSITSEKLMAEAKLNADVYYNELKSKADEILETAKENAEKIKSEYEEDAAKIIDEAREHARDIKKKNKDKVEDYIREKKAEIRELKQSAKEEVRLIYTDAEQRKELAEEKIEKLSRERARIKEEAKTLLKDIQENKHYYTETEERIRAIEKEKRTNEDLLTDLKMKVVEGQAELQRKKDLLELEVSRHKAEMAQVEAESKMRTMRDELNFEQIQAKRNQAEADILGLRKEREECEQIIKSIDDLKKKEEELKFAIANVDNEKQLVYNEIDKINNQKKILQTELDNFQMMVNDNRRELVRLKEEAKTEAREIRMDGEEDAARMKAMAAKDIEDTKTAAEDHLKETRQQYLREEERIDPLIKEHNEKVAHERREVSEELIAARAAAEKEIHEWNKKAEEEIHQMHDRANKEIEQKREAAQIKLVEDIRESEEKLINIKRDVKERTVFLEEINENIAKETNKRHEACDDELEKKRKAFTEELNQVKSDWENKRKEVENWIVTSREQIKSEEEKCEQVLEDKRNQLRSQLQVIEKESKDKINAEKANLSNILQQMKDDAHTEALSIVENAKEMANISMAKAKKRSEKILDEVETLHRKKENELERVQQEANEKVNKAEREKKTILEAAEEEKQGLLKEAYQLLEQSKKDVELAEKDIENYKNSEITKQSELTRQWEQSFAAEKKQAEREEAAKKMRAIDEEKQARARRDREFEAKLKHDGDAIAKNLENVISIKIKNYLGLKDSNIDTQSQELQESLNGLNKDIGVVIGSVIRGESLEGNAALKNLMQFNPKTIDKVKKFYTKIGVAVAVPVFLLILGWIFPNMYSSMRMGVVSFLAPEESMSDIYAKKLAKARADKPTFNPNQTANFKDTYSDNVLYTKNFVLTKLDPNYQDKFTVAINGFILDELELDEETVINFISLEIKVIQDLMESRDSIFIEKQEEGIARLKQIEVDWIPEVVTLMKTEENYTRLYEFQREFYTNYLKENPPIERRPASTEEEGDSESSESTEGDTTESTVE